MNTIKSIVRNIIIVAGLSAITVFAWTGPTAPPPDNNTSAPINVSSAFQSKSGSLWIDGGLGVGGGATIGTNGGNVGIGATTPSNKLEVLKASTPGAYGTGSVYGLRVNYGGATYTGLHLGDFGYGNASVIQTFNQALSLNPAGNNVGIGVTNPTAKLEINSASSDGGLRIFQGVTGPILSLFDDGKGQATTDEVFRVERNGNVGIGMTAPDTKLKVLKASASGAYGTGSEYGFSVSAGGTTGLHIGDFGNEGGSIQTFNQPMVLNPAGNNVGIGITTPAQKLEVAGYVKGTGLCIGTDCRTSWPVATSSGNVSGSGTSGALTNWTGANSISNYNGASCPAGQVMSGLNANGTPNCVSQSTGTVSGFGTTGNLTKWNSLTSVTNYAGSNVCLSGTYAANVNADGTVNCMPSQMPTTQKICISDSTRVFTVPNTWLQVNCQSINAVWQGGRYQVGCIFSNSPYYSVSAGTIWNDPHGPLPNPNCGWD